MLRWVEGRGSAGKQRFLDWCKAPRGVLIVDDLDHSFDKDVDDALLSLPDRKTKPASRPRPHPGSGRAGVAGRGCSVAGLDGAARPARVGPGRSMSPFACRGGLVSPSALAHGSLQVASEV